jgi:hypothetical protein
MSDSLSQSDIGGSDISLSPILLITDIGLRSAHLCWLVENNDKQDCKQIRGQCLKSYPPPCNILLQELWYKLKMLSETSSFTQCYLSENRYIKRSPRLCSLRPKLLQRIRGRGVCCRYLLPGPKIYKTWTQFCYPFRWVRLSCRFAL